MTRTPRTHLSLVAALATLAVACTQHIAPYHPRERRFQPDDYPAVASAEHGRRFRG